LIVTEYIVFFLFILQFSVVKIAAFRFSNGLIKETGVFEERG